MEYGFKMTSFSSTILNLLFTEAERKGKTRKFRMYIGLGLDGSSADKLSLDLKFNPWHTAITFRLRWGSMSKTVFRQYDPSEFWYKEQSDAWLDDVKTFYHRPLRCAIVVHPYCLAQEDAFLFKESAYLSCAKKHMHRRLTFFSRLVQRRARDVEQETEERNIQQHSIHHRNQLSHVEFTDQHHPARPNDYVHGDSSD